MSKTTNLDIQGHRGCRGLLPENTIEGFVEAINLGVHTLEMDVTISKDHIVVVSHDPFFGHEFCLMPDGNEIKKEEEQNHKLYEMNLDDIQQYDTGAKFNEKFPHQKKMKTFKPSLAQVVEAVNEKLQDKKLDFIRYNIEIKRRPEWDVGFHPEYKEFADLVIAEITRLKILDHSTVQCFDVPSLQYIKETYPHVKLVLLIQNLKSAERNIEHLGFVPEVYSPYYKLVNEKLVRYCKEQKMQLIPWTINELDDMKNLIDLGVDGIITDYPDRLIALMEAIQ